MIFDFLPHLEESMDFDLRLIFYCTERYSLVPNVRKVQFGTKMHLNVQNGTVWHQNASKCTERYSLALFQNFKTSQYTDCSYNRWREIFLQTSRMISNTEDYKVQTCVWQGVVPLTWPPWTWYRGRISTEQYAAMVERMTLTEMNKNDIQTLDGV